MINRSKIKYVLKKVLPKPLFTIVVLVWQQGLLKIVTLIDSVRLQKFTKKQIVHLTHNEHSFYLTLSPHNGFVDNYIYLYGIYEPFILDIFSEHLHEGDTFLDIGTNIGQHSMFAATLVGERGKVHSFEPIPYIYKQLEESIIKNKFDDIITAHNFALGEQESSQELYLEEKNIGSSSFVESQGRNNHITVHIKRGDDILSSEEKITLIKIDVEGYEYEVLSGIQATLTKHKPVIVLEFSYESYKNNGKGHGEKILSLLTEQGYDMYDIEENMKKIISHQVFLSSFIKGKIQTNILCLPSKK